MIKPFSQFGSYGGPAWPPAVPIDVSPKTGPLSVLRGKRVACIVDYQNLAFSAADLGLKLCWSKLAQTVRAHCLEAELHLVFSDREVWDVNFIDLRNAGWKLAIKRTGKLLKRPLQPNADNLFSFVCGQLSHHGQVELFLLGTGDGELALDAAQMLVAAAPAAEIGTLSLAGSTSQRLDARLACDIDFNLELGLDCLA